MDLLFCLSILSVLLLPIHFYPSIIYLCIELSIPLYSLPSPHLKNNLRINDPLFIKFNTE
jgi:hypothetical protein